MIAEIRQQESKKDNKGQSMLWQVIIMFCLYKMKANKYAIMDKGSKSVCNKP